MKLLLLPAELYKMVCEPDETDLDIKIPAVMLPQDAGASLEKMLMNNSSTGKQQGTKCPKGFLFIIDFFVNLKM